MKINLVQSILNKIEGLVVDEDTLNLSKEECSTLIELLQSQIQESANSVEKDNGESGDHAITSEISKPDSKTKSSMQENQKPVINSEGMAVDISHENVLKNNKTEGVDKINNDSQKEKPKEIQVVSENKSDEDHPIKENVSKNNAEIVNKASKDEKSKGNLLAPTLTNGINKPKNHKEPTVTKQVQIRNGMVGKEYSVEFSSLKEFSDIHISEIRSLDNKHIGEYGLKFDIEQQTLYGTHKLQGEHKFGLIYSMAGERELSNISNRSILISVLPDPKSLWKVLEPAEGTIYQKKHSEFDSNYFHEYYVLGGSQRGRTHAHEGTFRDDDFLIRKVNDDILFLAVADGAGYAKYSREGSRIACDVCYNTFEKELRDSLIDEFTSILIQISEDKTDLALNKSFSKIFFELFAQAVKESRDAIIERASQADHKLRDYATTLLMCLVIKVKSKYCILSYGIGDGIIAHLDKEENINLLTTPDGGQFAGQTRFLIMNEALSELSKRIKVTFIEDLSGLYLMTDGISDPFFETDANFNKMEKWRNLESNINKAVDFKTENIGEQFVDWLDFFSKGNHDDRTIVYVKEKEMIV